jgi:hypothetical protein
MGEQRMRTDETDAFFHFLSIADLPSNLLPRGLDAEHEMTLPLQRLDIEDVNSTTLHQNTTIRIS